MSDSNRSAWGRKKKRALVPVVIPPAVPARKTATQKGIDRVKVQEDRVLQAHQNILEDAALASDPAMTEEDDLTPLQLQELGDGDERKAKRRKRVASDARNSARYAPFYLTLSQKIVGNIQKARATAKSGHTGPIAQINVFVSGNRPERQAVDAQYEVVDADE